MPSNSILLDTEDQEEPFPNSILNKVKKYERIDYSPVNLPIMYSESYRILCGDYSADSRILNAVSVDSVMQSVPFPSVSYVESMYSAMMDSISSGGANWLPSWCKPSPEFGERIDITTFIHSWKQCLASLSPGLGLSIKESFIPLPESETSRNHLRFLLSSIPLLSTEVSESAMQTILRSFDVTELTENRESIVSPPLSPHSQPIKRHWSSLYLPSLFLSHCLARPSSFSSYLAQQFARILIRLLCYLVSTHSLTHPLILPACVSSFTLFFHSCETVKYPFFSLASRLSPGILLQPLCDTSLAMPLTAFVLCVFRSNRVDDGDLAVFSVNSVISSHVESPATGDACRAGRFTERTCACGRTMGVLVRGVAPGTLWRNGG